MELNKFDEYMQTIKEYQLKANGKIEEKKTNLEHPILLTQEQIEEHFDTLDYTPQYLKDIKLVLKLALDIVVKEKLRPDNPAEKIEIETAKKSLGIEIEHLEQDRQEVRLDLFEKDKRQWAYLFESILLTGARPEEGCGFMCNGF